jgi:hypothetical protein
MRKTARFSGRARELLRFRFIKRRSYKVAANVRGGSQESDKPYRNMKDTSLRALVLYLTAPARPRRRVFPRRWESQSNARTWSAVDAPL